LATEIEKGQAELVIYKKELNEYLNLRSTYDEKSTKVNDYQKYVKMMNSDGISYEIIKRYLPLIESDINSILHSMVNFSIEFVFTDTDSSEAKTRSIDINICHQDIKPCNVQLASGFERFIINLAVRMILSRISITSKPNFLIIDEGWSCLDAENMNSINIIMNYIKTQAEHIIIISHLEEPKNQADYIINIDKINNYSHVRLDKKMIAPNRSRKTNQKKLNK